MSAVPLRVLERPAPARLPASVESFLSWLDGPACIRIPGRDRTRCRALVTLVHGNEPSGVRAVHGWLRGGRTPATDVVLVVVSIAAALAPPGFAHRMLPGARDLNRCFRPPFEGAEGALARALLDVVEAARPEALLDLHNNTGHNPPYAVACGASVPEQRLASLFGERLVHSELRLGSLVEAAAALCPSVTIECGRAGDAAADEAARRGLERFLGEADLALGTPPAQRLAIFVDSVRVCVRAGVRLAFGERPVEGADLTLLHDVDRHNFERLARGHVIAWLREGGEWPLEARDARGRERSHELFAAADGALSLRRELVPIMMTLDPAAALGDCLFYAVRPAG